MWLAKKHIYLVQALATIVTASPVNSPQDKQDGLQIQTDSGVVTGIIDPSYPDVRQFLGIPFAVPPLDKLRFLPPQPLVGESQDKLRFLPRQPLARKQVSIDATKPPLACSQYAAAAPTIYNQDVPQFDINVGTSEDCLKVTIWTPKPDECKANAGAGKSGLPVFIWIYGGGFSTGGTEVPYQIPLEWIQRTQSHIVVSIQYRMNIFGFPNAAGLNTSNVGILDMRAAIEYIQKNIAAFGGDPDRMVTWGQSAGALSADILNFAYPSDPIVKGQICDSGFATPGLPSPSASTGSFSLVASQVGCPSILNGSSPQDELSCMQTVPMDKLEGFLKQYGDAGTQPSLLFIPVSDNKTAFADYAARYALGPGKGVSAIPAIFGTNRDEGRATYWPPDPNFPPNLTLAEQATLDQFLCPVITDTQLRTQAGLKTYRYLYEGNFTDVSPRYWEGAYHASELPQIFGTRGDFRGPASPFELAVSRGMQDRWLNFAKDPQNPRGWVDSGATQSLVVFARGSPGKGKVAITSGVSSLDAPCATASST